MADLILWDATIVDARSSSPQRRMSITVRGDKIAEVCKADHQRPGDEAIDLGGAYVVPGLIDAHIHLGDDPAMMGDLAVPLAMRGEAPHHRELVYFVLANAARAFLRSGITTIRDVGCYDDNAIVLREAIRLGLTEGPTILSCGRIVSATAPGAVLFKSMYEEADGPWQLRQCVRNQLRRGADYVKVMAGGGRSADGLEPNLVEQAKRQKEEAYKTLVAARDKGVVIAMGFDSGPPGADALELVRMVEGGLTAHEALTAATMGSAQALGVTDAGTIEAGRRADLVVLDHNPLDDVAVFT